MRHPSPEAFGVGFAATDDQIKKPPLVDAVSSRMQISKAALGRRDRAGGRDQKGDRARLYRLAADCEDYRRLERSGQRLSRLDGEEDVGYRP